MHVSKNQHNIVCRSKLYSNNIATVLSYVTAVKFKHFFFVFVQHVSIPNPMHGLAISSLQYKAYLHNTRFPSFFFTTTDTHSLLVKSERIFVVQREIGMNKNLLIVWQDNKCFLLTFE